MEKDLIERVKRLSDDAMSDGLEDYGMALSETADAFAEIYDMAIATRFPMHRRLSAIQEMTREGRRNA